MTVIDLLQIGRFITGLFAYATEGSIVSVRTFHDDKQRDAGAAKIRTVLVNGDGLGPVIEVATKLAAEAAEDDRPIVVARNSRAVQPGSDCRRNRAAPLALVWRPRWMGGRHELNELSEHPVPPARRSRVPASDAALTGD